MNDTNEPLELHRPDWNLMQLQLFEHFQALFESFNWPIVLIDLKIRILAVAPERERTQSGTDTPELRNGHIENLDLRELLDRNANFLKKIRFG